MSYYQLCIRLSCGLPQHKVLRIAGRYKHIIYVLVGLVGIELFVRFLKLAWFLTGF